MYGTFPDIIRDSRFPVGNESTDENMVLPIFKLATLLIKQFARPVVNNLSESAKHYPRFRKSIIKIAQCKFAG